MKFMIIRFIMAGAFLAVAYRWGDWKNRINYYPTMLFFGMGDLIYNVVFQDKPLWKFASNILSPSINELFVIFTIFFGTTLLYLSNFPKKLYHQVIYTILWISLYMVIEIFTTSIGMQKNYNGWNIWWSLFHNTIQFPLLIIHHKNPILAWIIAFLYLGFTMNIFGIPLIQ
jgi:hypothetical protein